MAQQWKPPDYATPDWTPPDYATPEGEKPKRIKKEPTFSDKVIAEIAKIDPRNTAAFAVRGLSAFAPGGPLGAIAGGAGEALAQTIEPREDYNPTQIATQAAIGAIPFGRRVATLGRTALKGAAMGAGATTASQLAETGELPSLGQFGLGTTLGAAGGAVASKFAKKIAPDLPDIKEGRIFGRLEPEVSTPRKELPTPITKPRVRIYPKTVKIEEAPPTKQELDFLKQAQEKFAQFKKEEKGELNLEELAIRLKASKAALEASDPHLTMIGHFVERFGPDWITNFKRMYVDRLDNPEDYFNNKEKYAAKVLTKVNNLIDEHIKGSQIERLFTEETGAVKLPDEETYNNIKNRVFGMLRSGERIDLDTIYKRVSGVTKRQFNAVIDDILAGGIGEKAAAPKTPVQSARDNLVEALEGAKGLRAQQDVLYSEERSRRFSEYLKVKTKGIAGARERLAKLRGEHEKVNVAPIEMKQEELGTLFDAINTSHLLTPGEMAHASEGLFKLIDGGHVPQLNEIDALERVFGMGFRDSLLNIFSDEGGALNTAMLKGLKFAKTANTMKAMMASYDMSAPLRQGLPLIHRKEYWGAAANMFKYASSTKEFTEAMTSLQKRPNYILSREAGLHWSDINSLSHGEEQFGLNTYIHDIHEKLGKTGAILTAPTRASERAYVGFLNKLRHDTFDAMVSAARAAGADVSMKVITGPSGKLKRVPSKDLAAIAKFVNNATGRGELKIGKYDFERFGPLANFAFFSPRLMMSRVNMLTNPKLYSELPKGVRLEGLKSLLSIGSMAAVAGGLASVLGGEQTWNPLSSDFGKARFGEQVLDPYGGFQQYIVLGARLSTMLAGGKINSQEGLFEPSMGSVSGNFLMNKLAPMTSLIIEYMRSTTGKRGDEWYERRNRFGQPMNPVDEVTKRVAPIITQDLYELFTTDQSLAKVLGLGTASFFGMGSQTYPEPNQQRQRLRISSPRLSL